MRFFVLLGSIMLLFALTTTATAATLLVADFDTENRSNNIGGEFGAWDKDPADDTQGCRETFDSNVKHGKRGYSIRLDYDVGSPNPAYNGFWMKLQNQDISKYDKLVLWIKGDDMVGFSEKIKLELKNTEGEVGKYTLSSITSNWQEVSVPLSQFKGLTDLKSMTEFVIVFDDITCARNKTGAIYIDDIAFVK